MTLAESIREMEQYLESYRRVDAELQIWKMRYEMVDDKEKRKMLVKMLARLGLDESCLTPITNKDNTPI